MLKWNLINYNDVVCIRLEIFMCLVFLIIDVDTRRRAASDLIRGLCKHFEAQVTNICSAYVNVMLQVIKRTYLSIEPKDGSSF